MRNLAKLAVLGATLAAYGTVAFASPIPLGGQLATAGGGLTSSPAIFTATSTSATLSGPLFEPGVLTAPPPTGSLADFVASTYIITDNPFSTAAITAAGPTGLLIMSIADTGAFSASNPAGGDTLNFFATSFANIIPSSASSEGSINLFGYFTDGGAFSSATGQLGFSANGLNNNFTADLIATPVLVTPEPSSLLLLGTGLVGGAGAVMRRRKA
jgi:PEP-CTERM motif